MTGAVGWIRVDASALARFARLAVCVAGKWGSVGEALPAPAGRVCVEVTAVAHAFPAFGALLVNAFVVPDRITTLRLPPFSPPNRRCS